MPRLTGKQGSVSFGANKIADVFDITLEINQELLDATIKFEVHDVVASGGVNSRLTCQRYITDTALNVGANPEVGGSVTGKNLVNNVPAVGNSFVGASVTWSFTTGAGGGTAGFNVSGEGFLERVTQNNPRGLASETWEIRNIVVPTVTG